MAESYDNPENSGTLDLFFPPTPTTAMYTLSLHDALPIFRHAPQLKHRAPATAARRRPAARTRSEVHTSELQSQSKLVCRLLLEKKKFSPVAVTVFSVGVC